MVPTKARIIDEVIRDGARPITHHAPNRRRSLAVREEELGVARRINLKGAREAARNQILVGQSIVNLGIALIAVKGSRPFLNGVIGQIVVDDLRVERRCKQSSRDWANHAGRNHIARKRLPRGSGYACSAVLPGSPLTGVIQLDRGGGGLKCAKVAGLFCGCVHRYETACGRMVESLPLIVNEEEEFVLEDRSTEGSSKHVPAQRCASDRRRAGIDLVFPLVGVQLVIAEEFPDIAVKRIGARLEGRTNDAAHVISEFRRRVIAYQVEFLNCVRRWGVAKKVVRNLVIVHPIEEEVVCLLAITVDERPRPALYVVSVIETAGIRMDSTGRKQRQFHVVSSGKRKRIISLRINNGVD